ncbi:MAG: CPBP family intramembrane metalloprotease [Erysipelotrichales bacterium]|nr:CPBP family intramembrane metalloprotease [Erysipelotrichales bacterium]
MIKLCKISNKELGIKKENIFNSIKRNIPIIILFVVIVVIFRILNLNKFIPNESIMFYLFYIFISCPIQEFLYRGIFGYFETNLIKNKNITLVLSSLSYSFVHVIYKDIFTCLLTFIFGLVLYSLYRKDYNLAGVSLSHIILGILTIYLGIIN